MIDITKDNIRDLYNPLSTIFRNWAMVDTKIKTFENNATLETFRFIFKNDADRLFSSFRERCNGKFPEFKTFLTQEQINVLLMNIYINDDMYYLPMT